MKILNHGLLSKLIRTKWKGVAECQCGCRFKVKPHDWASVSPVVALEGCGFTATQKTSYSIMTVCPECGKQVLFTQIDEQIAEAALILLKEMQNEN